MVLIGANPGGRRQRNESITESINSEDTKLIFVIDANVYSSMKLGY